MHTFNPSFQEADSEAGVFLWVQGQSGMYRVFQVGQE